MEDDLNSTVVKSFCTYTHSFLQLYAFTLQTLIHSYNIFCLAKLASQTILKH